MLEFDINEGAVEVEAIVDEEANGREGVLHVLG